MYWIFTENKRLLQEAKLALKKSKRKDYYKILGVDKNASTDEILMTCIHLLIQERDHSSLSYLYVKNR
jgi:hypothetical protein